MFSNVAQKLKLILFFIFQRLVKLEIMILIMSVNIFKIIADLLPKSGNLTQFEKRCLIATRDWIKFSLSKLDESYVATRATAHTLLQQIIEDATLTDQETCIICDADILFNNLFQSTPYNFLVINKLCYEY